MNIEFRTTDVRKLSAKLNSKTKRVGAQAAGALRKTAAGIERDAKTFCPVDTGALKNSIGTDLTGDGRSGRMTAIIGPTMNYASYVERGTSRQAPQPYMRPAAERHVPRLERAIREIGGDIL